MCVCVLTVYHVLDFCSFCFLIFFIAKVVLVLYIYAHVNSGCKFKLFTAIKLLILF